MDISVIIVSYNTHDLTRQAIEAVDSSDTALNFEIIVVDNASPDNSGTRLLQYFEAHEQIRVVLLERNHGFAFANNIGAKHSSGNVLFFLNSDTIVEPSCIDVLFHAATREESTGVVGPHVLNKDGSNQQSTVSFPSVRSMVRHYLPLNAIRSQELQKQVNLQEEWAEVDIVKGCALAVRREIYDEIGGWDERFFLYSEETELCYQVHARGYKNRFTRKARLVHLGGASTSQEDYAKQQIIQQTSAVQFLRSHGKRGLATANRLLGTMGFGVRWLLFSVRGAYSPNQTLTNRRDAARVLFFWFLKDYPRGDDSNVT